MYERKFNTHKNLVGQPVAAPASTRLNVINYEADHSGCGHWRMFWPSHVMNARNDMRMLHPGIPMLDERAYSECAAVRVQRQVTPGQRDFVKFLRQVSDKHGCRLIYEIDDVMFREGIPMYNAFRTAFEPDEIRQASEEAMMLCDEITVTCKGLRDYYKAKTGHKNITIVPNFPPKWWIGNFYNKGEVHARYDANKKRPRILYPGAGAHFDVNKRAGKDDLSAVNDAIIASIKDYKWVFFGGIPHELQKYVESGDIEYHPWVNILQFPEKIHSLACQAIIAPLDDNDFNRGKSDIKIIEGGAFGLPVICQDLPTYENAAYKFRDGKEMLQKIHEAVGDAKTYKSLTQRWREMAEARFLERPENIGCYKELFTTKPNEYRPLLSRFQ